MTSIDRSNDLDFPCSYTFRAYEAWHNEGVNLPWHNEGVNLPWHNEGVNLPGIEMPVQRTEEEEYEVLHPKGAWNDKHR